MNPAPVVNEGLLKNFEDGYEAFSKVSLRRNKFFHQMANPMRKDTVSHREWQRGWNTAYFENLEKQNGLGTRG
jgi:hypothetical protein